MSDDPPAGTTARPLEPGDLDAVVELERASQEHDGLEGLDRSDIEAGWRRPDFRLAAMSVGVFDGDLLAGYAEVFNGRAEASVRPSDRGRGIGTWLARATWSLARELGWRSVGQTVPEAATDATATLRALGYRVGHTSWLLGIDLDREPRTPDLPDGCTFHGFAPVRDERALFDVIDPAFDEWPGRVSEGFENWRELVLRRPQVRPELVVVIAHGDRPVGAAIGFDYGDEQDGVIQQLAVERSWRGRGLGRALLQESFRRSWNAGRRTVGLSTDSRTGALGLYLHVGMDVRATYIRMTKELSPEAPPA